MLLRCPVPLRPGDLVGVTASSAGVSPRMQARLEHAVAVLEGAGLRVRLGDCLFADGLVSAPASARAAELTAMLTDPQVRAVVPPWGGELAIDLLPLVDWDAIARAEPTWLVGYSDLSTLLLPLTLLTGTMSVHGQNLMDTPYAVPAPQLSWREVLAAGAGSTVRQGPAAMVRGDGWDDYEAHPQVDRYTFDTPGGWSLLHDDGADLQASGRLVGGCLEIVRHLVGTRYGDVPTFAREHAPDGTVVYLEVAEVPAVDVARSLHGLRLAGWFEHASAVLVGRTQAPPSGSFTQRDAVADALGGLDVPVVLDVDCGHVPPHLALVNGARTSVSRAAGTWSLAQVLG
ncbi:S66 family peptidase [Cellulomonas soli]|uniref:LD-carboxypeptidase n=1 Tax=Cellulomonas soli TaxID=931535 RepID=A0A512PH50_9CELL|nr:S66 peptidase family protein [Cellulomonas soli]NYI60882.1 muramoyltetrapeptide carboxypeptidase LdcA involved in peptidoglycan recycling [Cellulomonas soli]GEP70534.1 LD-carboxypeptidase [Cellulomonas soli]